MFIFCFIEKFNYIDLPKQLRAAIPFLNPRLSCVFRPHSRFHNNRRYTSTITHKNTHTYLLKIHDPTRHTCLSTRYTLHSSCCGIWGFLQRTAPVHSSPQHPGFVNVFRRNQIAPQVYIFHIWWHCKVFRRVDFFGKILCKCVTSSSPQSSFHVFQKHH